MAIELYCNQSINGTLSTTGTGTFGGDVTIGGTTGSTGNALSVNRGSDGSQALRVQNSGEVVVNVNYLYAASSGTSLYVQNTAVFRGAIVNDGGDVTIADTLSVTGDATFAGAVTIANISGSETSPETQLLFDNNNIDDSGGYNIDFKTSSNDTANRYMSRIQALRTTSAKSSLGFFTESGSALTRALLLDDSQNATFSGDITVSGGDITLGSTGRIQGVDTVSAGTDAANKNYVDNAVSGTMSNWNLTADSGGSQSITQGTTVDIAGGTNITTSRTGATVQINNSITNNNQLTNGAGYTTNTGTVTGTGTSGQIAIFNGTSSVTSNSGLSEVSLGVLFVNNQVQVKGVNNADYTVAGDTDTGLGSFDGANGVSLVSKGAKQITVKEGSTKFDQYTATAVSTTGPLNANQNNQAPTQDTLATLAVDPSGNVVRGEQEATFKFTRAQLNTTLGQTLISAPGTGRAVVITYTDWMMEYTSTGSVATQQNLEIRQANLAQSAASVSVLPALRFNEIVNQSQSPLATPWYGFYTRDIPTGSGSQGRTYAVNKATTFHKQTASAFPSGLTSISIKIRYRIFDVDTF